MKKKKNSYKIFSIITLLLVGQLGFLNAQEEEKAEPIRKKAFVVLQYHCINNSAQYVSFQAIAKANKVVEPLKGIPVSIYLEDNSNETNLIGKVISKEDGRGLVYFPASLKESWKPGTGFKIYAVTDSIPEYGNLESELEITRSKILIDTSSNEEGHVVSVKVMMMEDTAWVPVPDVELKIGVSRLGGSLINIGEEETYTTDAEGVATADYLLKDIPGDRDGNIELIARIEDHDQMGSIETMLPVQWGKATVFHSRFGERSLWATGDKVPLWLLGLAIFIITSVWGTLIVLIYRFFKLTRIKST